VSAFAATVLTAAALLPAAFFTTAGFVDGAAAFFAATFLLTVTTVLAVGDFLTAAFFVTTFLAAAFFATTPFLPVAFGLLALLTTLASAATAPAPSIKKLVRSFAPASHAGAGPRPLHVAPDFGSRYFAGCGPFGCPW
jgi:hypothetical protein